MVTENDSINQVEELAPAQDTSVETQTTPASEPDWKAEAEKQRQAAEGFRSQVERESQLRKVAEGRLAKEAETNKRLLRVEHYARQAVPEEDRSALDRQADEEARQLQAQQENVEYTAKQITSLERVIDNNLVRLGKDLKTDPTLVHIKALKERGALGEVVELLDEMVQADQRNKVETARIARQTRQEKLDIATPRPAAQAIHITDENADTLFNQQKITKEQYRSFLQEKGIL